jgi:acetyl esterase/lipase
MIIRATVCVALGLLLLQGAAISQTGDIKPFISEQVSPMEVIVAKDRDGVEIPAVVRRPPGRQGPFPALVSLHGGLVQLPIDELKRRAAEPLETLFLAEGYMVVEATYRSRNDDPQRPETVWSIVAMIEHVKKLPGVDPKSVVVVGSSGGGSLALELAAETDVAAIAPWEPATILFMGMLTKNSEGGVGRNAQRLWTPEIQQKTRERLSRIRCPVFVGNGPSSLNFNHDIFFPELMKTGKPVQIHIYPGMPHPILSAYIPKRLEHIKRYFEDSNSMFKRYLAAQPVPVDRKILQWVADLPPKTDSGARQFLNLRDRKTIRPEDPPAPGEVPVGSFRTRVLRLTIFLPSGSDAGDYELQILREAGVPIMTMGGSTTIDENKNLILQLQFDLTGFEIGRRVLSIRKVDSEWKYYPINLRLQP